MKQKIRLTEEQLRQVIRENINKAVNEGQGWNKFRTTMKNLRNGDITDQELMNFNTNDPEYREQRKNYINRGNGHGFQDDYYDEEGNGAPCSGLGSNKKMNKGMTGRLGRWAGTKASEIAMNHAKNKRGLAEAQLRNIVKKVIREEMNLNQAPTYQQWVDFLNGKMPVIEFEDEIVYVDYDENNGTLASGGVTNIGFHKDGEAEVEVIDGNFQAAMEELYDQLSCQHDVFNDEE